MQHLTVVDHPLVQHKLSIMRQKEVSTAGFRRLLREISLLLAYEVTRELELTTMRIETPMCEMEAPTLEGKKLAEEVAQLQKQSRLAHRHLVRLEQGVASLHQSVQRHAS